MPTRTVALAVSLDHVLSLCLAPHPLCQSTEHSSAFISIPMAYPDHVPPRPPLKHCLQFRTIYLFWGGGMFVCPLCESVNPTRVGTVLAYPIAPKTSKMPRGL